MFKEANIQTLCTLESIIDVGQKEKMKDLG